MFSGSRTVFENPKKILKKFLTNFLAKDLAKKLQLLANQLLLFPIHIDTQHFPKMIMKRECMHTTPSTYLFAISNKPCFSFIFLPSIDFSHVMPLIKSQIPQQQLYNWV